MNPNLEPAVREDLCTMLTECTLIENFHFAQIAKLRRMGVSGTSVRHEARRRTLALCTNSWHKALNSRMTLMKMAGIKERDANELPTLEELKADLEQELPEPKPARFAAFRDES